MVNERTGQRRRGEQPTSRSSCSTASGGSWRPATLPRARSDGAEPGRRLGEELPQAIPGLLVLFLESPPEFSAYQELRAGFTAAVSHELRTPLARLLVLLESAVLPGSDVGELMEQARRRSSRRAS